MKDRTGGCPRYCGAVRWPERLLLFVASAVVLVSVDPVVKAAVNTPLWAFHHRSYGWVAFSIAVLVGAFLLTLVRPAPWPSRQGS
jgi:hypothetical protein